MCGHGKVGGGAWRIVKKARQRTYRSEMDENAARIRLPQLAIIVSFIAVFCFISFTATLQKSLTFDEPLHLYAGYSYIEWRDFRVNPEHPPLVKALAALPLLTLRLSTGGITQAQRDRVQVNKDYSWELANQFIYENRDNRKFLLYPKMIMIGLACVLGLVVFLWAQELYGLNAALAALAMYSLDPNILAHSSIIHTDVPFALFFLAGTYFFWRLLNRFTWIGLLGTSVCFALSSITKFSFLVIAPVWILLATIHIFSFRSTQDRKDGLGAMERRIQKAILALLILVTVLGATYLSIRGIYGFQLNAVAQQQDRWPIGELTANAPWIARFWLVSTKHSFLPEAWLYGLADAVKLFDRHSYLLGEISAHGFWLYFPVAFAVKTPVPILILSAMGLTLICIRRRVCLADLFVLAPAVIFFSFAVCSRLNIGLRHILPVYPFLFVWLGGVTSAFWNMRNNIGRCGVLVLGLWLVLCSLRVYPDYLTFFNELAGGPKNGYRYLVDSNLDWGQDLKGLKRWMDNHKVGNIRLAYFGTMDPAFYDIKAIPEPGSLSFLWRNGQQTAPLPPYIAISRTYLAGLYLPRRDTYAAFRNRSPVASIGNSILIYRLD